MKIYYALPLAVAIGLGFGAVAIRGLHARTTTPPVYVGLTLPLWKSKLRTVAISREQKM
jgi:hypothetical protein